MYFAPFALLALVVASVGMFLFWRPARLIYVGCVVVILPLYLFLDDVIYSTPVGAIFNDLSVMATGAVLAMAFLSPMKERFGRKSIKP